jgi:hypothetical protein
MTLAQAPIGEGGGQDDAMLKSGIGALAGLDRTVQVEEDPPVAGGGVLELTNIPGITAGGGWPVDGTEGVAGGILTDGIDADGGLEGRAAGMRAFANGATGSDLDGREGEDGGQDQQDGRVGEGGFDDEKPEGIGGAQAERPEGVKAAAGAKGGETPAGGVVGADGGDAGGEAAGEGGMVVNLEPEGGGPAGICHGKALLEAVADLGPTVAQLAVEAQGTGEGTGPEVSEDPTAAKDDKQDNPGAGGPDELEEKEEGGDAGPEAGARENSGERRWRLHEGYVDITLCRRWSQCGCLFGCMIKA